DVEDGIAERKDDSTRGENAVDAEIDCFQTQKADAFVSVDPIQAQLLALGRHQLLEPRYLVGFEKCAPGKDAQAGAGDKIAGIRRSQNHSCPLYSSGTPCKWPRQRALPLAL